jgi:hypothetical protein
VADALVAAAPIRLPHGPSWGSEDSIRSLSTYEPVDWLTLLRLLGWSATVVSWCDPALEASRGDVVVVAGDPDEMPSACLHPLVERLRRDAVLLIGPAGSVGRWWRALGGSAPVRPGARPDFAGRKLAWVGPGGHVDYNLAVDLPARELEASPGAEVWATLDGRPVVVARRFGPQGVIATIGLERAPDCAPAAIAIIKRVLTCGCPAPTAWLDFAGTLVLRMDDPGGAPNVHLRSWSYRRLAETEWRELGEVLRLRGAHMSVGYTPGWLDDGDAERGTVLIDGAEPSRRLGAVHQSARLVHLDRAGHAPGRINDYASEYRGIERLRVEGLVSVELHGYTHMHVDVESWARAPDRYEDVSWYREFTPESDAVLATRGNGQHPLVLGVDLLRKTFGVPPTTLVCPGDAWTPSTLRHALGVGLSLVAARGLALRDDGRFCWCAGVATIALNAPTADHFAGELPVVCRFHDLEPATLGVPWFREALDEWRRLGARRLIDFRELSSALAMRLRLCRGPGGQWRLSLGHGGPPLPRPLPVLLHMPGGPPPAEIRLESSENDLRLPVQTIERGIGRVMLPAGVPRPSPSRTRPGESDGAKASPRRSRAESRFTASRVSRPAVKVPSHGARPSRSLDDG